jgi:hypothetical protein
VHSAFVAQARCDAGQSFAQYDSLSKTQHCVPFGHAVSFVHRAEKPSQTIGEQIRPVLAMQHAG